MRISDWSSDVCSSDLLITARAAATSATSLASHCLLPHASSEIAMAWRMCAKNTAARSEEHTSELQSLMRISYAVFCLKKKTNNQTNTDTNIDLKLTHNKYNCKTTKKSRTNDYNVNNK